MAAWRGGRWGREWHDGRYGWWWNTGGAWYFYDEPVYPYPLVVSPTIVGVPVAEAEPEPPPQAAPVALPPPNRSLYYCSNPAGYYPAVPSCPGGFRPAAGTP